MKAIDVATHVCDVKEKVQAAWDHFRQAVSDAEKLGFRITLNSTLGGQIPFDIDRMYIRIHADV